ncbi:MAG: hypothetical protein ACRDKX_01940, partial [Solirubrobacterales bacterium]
MIAALAIASAIPGSAAATWSSPFNLSAAGGDAGAGQVAVEPDGDSVFVWERFDGSGAGCCTRIQTRTRSAAGALGGPTNLSPAGDNSFDPQVAVDGDGDAIFVWHNDGLDWLQTRTRSAAGVLGQTQKLSTVAQDARDPQIAVDADGDAVFAWLNLTTGRIQARARSAAGVLSSFQT